MKICSSNTKNSSILAMGDRLRKAMADTGNEYLMLNRGVNSVVNIDLMPVVNQIDFNSDDIQVYPGSKGKIELRQAINQEYFDNKAQADNIIITGGGISGLDITVQNIAVDEFYLPAFFWGTYAQLLALRKKPFKNYQSYAELNNSVKQMQGKGVIICDPGNPKGDKYPDNLLFEVIKNLNDAGAVVLFDSPYRRLFFDRSDTFYQQLLGLENVIIIESFSKSVGLSGQRIGFIHAINPAFVSEALLRIMFATNGVNSFSQVLISRLLTTDVGQKAIADFKQKTTQDIKKNIDFLITHNLLATDLYQETSVLGIFAVIKKSPETLFNQRIGSVGVDYFVAQPFEGIENLSRILVSYPHEKFVSFFKTII